MPWTLAHPAAVLPLRGARSSRLPLLALVIGSMAPDFGHHLASTSLGRFGHSLPGLFLWCMPLTVLLSVLVVRWRHLLVAPLPQPHRAAIESLAAPPTRSPRDWLALALAGVLGALTHITWDAFTHSFGFVVRHVAVLHAPLGEIGNRTFYVYSVLQHGSTVVGVAILAFAYARWLRRAAAAAQAPAAADRSYVPLLACVVVAAGLGVSGGALAVPPSVSFASFVVTSVILSTDAFVFVYLATAAWLSRRRRP